MHDANVEFYGLRVSCPQSAELFFYIGMIASMRRILTTGAQVPYLGELTDLILDRYLMGRWANVLYAASLDYPAKVYQFSWEGDLTMVRPVAFIAEMWWEWFHQPPFDPVYVSLIWNRTLRRVL